jgi:two-component system nitrate/nitrite sensor histidine kinase NarX
VETLRDYLQLWQEQSGVAASLRIEPEERIASALTPLSEVQLLRIVQEALTNVRKHAGATRAVVSMTLQDRVLVVSIEDDGAGFDPDTLGRAQVPRFGLATMRERAEAIGGTLSVSAAPGAGTMVQVRMPAEPSPGRGEPIRARSDR